MPQKKIIRANKRRLKQKENRRLKALKKHNTVDEPVGDGELQLNDVEEVTENGCLLPAPTPTPTPTPPPAPLAHTPAPTPTPTPASPMEVPLQVPTQGLLPIHEYRPPPLLLDVMCGIGGVSEGFRACGYEVLLGVDKDERFKDSFERNHGPGKFMHQELNLSDYQDCVGFLSSLIIPHVHLRQIHVHFSPSFKNLSAVNQTRDAEQGIKEVQVCVRIGIALRETFKVSWSLEEVTTSILKEMQTIYPRITQVVNCFEYGVPQNRVRMLMGEGEWFSSLKQQLGPLRNIKDSVPFALTDDEGLQGPSDNKSVKGIWVRLRHGDGVRFGEEVAHCLTSHGSHWKNVVTDSKYREMTLDEMKIFQGFPKAYFVPWDKRVAKGAIAQAVPPLLATFMARAQLGLKEIVPDRRVEGVPFYPFLWEGLCCANFCNNREVMRNSTWPQFEVCKVHFDRTDQVFETIREDRGNGFSKCSDIHCKLCGSDDTDEKYLSNIPWIFNDRYIGRSIEQLGEIIEKQLDKLVECDTCHLCMCLACLQRNYVNTRDIILGQWSCPSCDPRQFRRRVAGH